MVACIPRTVVTLAFVLLLASCSVLQGGPIQRPLSYHVRDVVVMADAKVPASVIAGVDRRVAAAIRTTMPPAGAERVILTVKVDRFGHGHNARRDFLQAKYTVTAVSIETGKPVAKGRFIANSPTNVPGMEEEALAEEMASRIRFAFALTVPRLRIVPPPRTTSTQLASDVEVAEPFAATPPPGPASPLAPRSAYVQPQPERTVVPPVQLPRSQRPSVPPRGVALEDGASGTVRLGTD